MPWKPRRESVASILLCVLLGGVPGEVSGSSRCDQRGAVLDNLGWLANVQWQTLSPREFDQSWPTDTTQSVDPSDSCVNPDSCLCISSRRAPASSPNWETFCFSGSTPEQSRLSRVFIYRGTADVEAARGCAAVIMRAIAGPEVLGVSEPRVEPEAEQKIQWRDRIGHMNTAWLRIRRGDVPKFVLRILWEKQ